jgi:hypothetical protein
VAAEVDYVGAGEARGRGCHVSIADLEDATVTNHDGARAASRPARAIKQLAGVDDDDARLRRLRDGRS